MLFLDAELSSLQHVTPLAGDHRKKSKMKPYLLTGIILIVIGVIAFGYQGISYTTRDKVVDLGPIQVTAEKTKTIPLPPIVGGIALVGGILVLVAGSRKS